MLKLILKRISFLLTVSLLVNGLPASASEFDTLLCLEKSGKIARDYGRDNRDRDYRGKYYDRDGENGRDGRSGRSGRSGRDATVFADGSAVNLDLSGRDGEDGEDGDDGYRPRCRRGYGGKVKRNIHAPDGGRGGDAGSGGNGGSGGSVTVYYSNIADI